MFGDGGCFRGGGDNPATNHRYPQDVTGQVASPFAQQYALPVDTPAGHLGINRIHKNNAEKQTVLQSAQEKFSRNGHINLILLKVLTGVDLELST